MKVLNIRDRLKLILRSFKLAFTKDLRALSYVWQNSIGTSSHTFYVDGDIPIDPVIETFIKVCSQADSEEKMNRFAANWLLRIAEQYAESKGISKLDIKVMAHPIRICVEPFEVLEEKSTMYISNSFMDPTYTHVKDLYRILTWEQGKVASDSLNEAMEYLRKHYPEKVKDLV